MAKHIRHIRHRLPTVRSMAAPSLFAPMPTFTPLQIAEVVFDRLSGVGHPGETAVRWRLIQADPEAADLARVLEARMRHLIEHAEDPVALFERLTGATLAPSPPKD